MAFSGNFLSTQFKIDLMTGTHNFTNSTGNTFKLALFKSGAVASDYGGSGSTMNGSVTTYQTTNEVSGTGYSAGGSNLTNVSPSAPVVKGNPVISVAPDAVPVNLINI